MVWWANNKRQQNAWTGNSNPWLTDSGSKYRWTLNIPSDNPNADFFLYWAYRNTGDPVYLSRRYQLMYQRLSQGKNPY